MASAPTASASSSSARRPSANRGSENEREGSSPSLPHTVVTQSTYDDQNLAHPLGNGADPESALMPDAGWRVPLVSPAPCRPPIVGPLRSGPLCQQGTRPVQPPMGWPILGTWLNGSTKLALWERFSRCLWQKYNKAWQ